MTYYTDAQFLARAREAYQEDGAVEFDDDAKVSRPITKTTSGIGAYVQAWVWVEFLEEEGEHDNTDTTTD